jgi:hypothetical protein
MVGAVAGSSSRHAWSNGLVLNPLDNLASECGNFIRCNLRRPHRIDWDKTPFSENFTGQMRCFQGLGYVLVNIG